MGAAEASDGEAPAGDLDGDFDAAAARTRCCCMNLVKCPLLLQLQTWRHLWRTTHRHKATLDLQICRILLRTLQPDFLRDFCVTKPENLIRWTVARLGRSGRSFGSGSR